MKRFFLVTLFLFLAAVVCACEPPISREVRNKRLVAIEEEIEDLQEQKFELEHRIAHYRQEEMRLEIASQPSIVTYEWHEMAEGLKKAENLEHKVKAEETILQELDKKILELTSEKHRLLHPKT